MELPLHLHLALKFVEKNLDKLRPPKTLRLRKEDPGKLKTQRPKILNYILMRNSKNAFIKSRVTIRRLALRIPRF